jgi:hypothetical protein
VTGEIIFSAASLIVAQAPPGGAPGAERGSPSPGAGAGAGRDDDIAAARVRDSGRRGSAGGPPPGRQRVLAGHTAYVSCLALGGEGRLLASGQEGRQPAVRLWDLESGECLAVLSGEV